MKNTEKKSFQNFASLPFFQKKSSFVGLILILILIFCSIFSGVITKYNPNSQGDLLLTRYQPPSVEHPFGTDKFGRDIFSRILYGGRISLSIAFSVVILSLTVGLFYGIISGYWGGWIDTIMMRVLDFLLAFPAIFLIITLIALFNLNHWFLIPLLALTGWMETARIVRAEILSIKEREFVLAAKGMGIHPFRIIIVHLIPNIITPVLVAAPLKIAEVILLESALSFLGIGVQPPTPSWGAIINDGRESLLNAWWISTFPGIFISITVMSFNLISDGVKDVINSNLTNHFSDH